MTARHDIRRLLELAAKAAGIDAAAGVLADDYGTLREWSPLDDDGDTLRLETHLKLTASWEPMRNAWTIGGIVNGKFHWLATDQDRKRATTMAAAAIGEAMP